MKAKAQDRFGGSVAVIIYFALFAAGLVLDSNPAREHLRTIPFDYRDFLMVMVAYTPINVAFLGLLAGFTGGCASRITYSDLLGERPYDGSHEEVKSNVFRLESPLASMFRSLIVYFGFMAGILIAGMAPFTTTTPEQYVRFAATISFFSFLVGYDPTKLQNIVGNIKFPGGGAGKPT